MSIQIQGSGGYVAEVDQNSMALRSSLRPADLLLGGHYQISAATGIMAAGIAGASEILQFRWLSTTHVAKIRYIRITAHALGTGFAAGTVLFDATIARAWTAVGTGGGVVASTTNQTKLKTSQLSSQMATASELNGSLRVATTAALGAGTKTLDSLPVSSLISAVPTTAFNDLLTGRDGVLLDARDEDREPITLVANEGFVIRTTVPATGTWTAHIVCGWQEVPTSIA